MQYAEVLINQKTNDWMATYSYGITADQLANIKIGSLVEVPFGRKITEGVIVNLKRTIPKNLTSVKQIKRVLQKGKVIDEQLIELSLWLAKNYFCSWSEAMFAILPDIPKKDLPVIDLKKIITDEPMRRRNRSLLLQTREQRYGLYVDMIAENKRKGRTTWIIFPDMLYLQEFVKINEDRLRNLSFTTYESNQTAVVKWKKWQEIQAGQFDLVLGSRMLLLCKPANVSTMIIDSSSDSGHREDQSPNYCSRDLAKYWQTKDNLSIVEGDIVPTAEQLFEIKNKKTHLIGKPIIVRCSVNIINMNQEKHFLCLQLVEQIKKTVRDKLTMIILLPRKGSGNATKCMDCGWTALCPKCDIPLTYYEKNRKLICRVCRFVQGEIAICPNCKSANIKTIGLGVDKLVEQVGKLVQDKYPVVGIDKENAPTGDFKPGIYIGTQAIFRYPIKADISGIVGAESFFAKPDYNSQQNAFFDFFKLANRTKETLIIQTNQPQENIFSAIKPGGWNYLSNLLDLRQKNHFPPFGNIIKGEVADKDEVKAKEKCRDYIKKIKTIQPDLEIIGPVQAYNFKERGLYKYQFLLMGVLRSDFTDLRKVLTGKIKIRINPESML